MSLSHFNHFPIESISLNNIQLALLMFGMIEFILLHIFSNNFGSFFNFFFQSQLCSEDVKVQAEEKKEELELSKETPCLKTEDGNLCRVDVETVMERLGLVCQLEGEKLQERFSSVDVLNMFEDKEPSLEEVKEAFDVFDENRDGFIDARELQRVISVLGFKEGLEMENCRRMIRAFDENGDGRIDFNEFAKFMESNF